MNLQQIKKRVKRVNDKLFSLGYSIGQVEKFWAECFMDAGIESKSTEEIYFNASLTECFGQQLDLFKSDI